MREVNVGDKGWLPGLVDHWDCAARVVALNPRLPVGCFETNNGSWVVASLENFTPDPPHPQTIMVELSVEDARAFAADNENISDYRLKRFIADRLYAACDAALRREGL